jgi:hypothetical protein
LIRDPVSVTIQPDQLRCILNVVPARIAPRRRVSIQRRTINMDPQSGTNPLRERFRWAGFGFIPGIVVGILLGWMFSGVVSWLVTFTFGLAILVPIVLLFLAWRWWNNRGNQNRMVMYEYSMRPPGDLIENRSRYDYGSRPPGDAIETQARVVDSTNGLPER